MRRWHVQDKASLSEFCCAPTQSWPFIGCTATEGLQLRSSRAPSGYRHVQDKASWSEICTDVAPTLPRAHPKMIIARVHGGGSASSLASEKPSGYCDLRARRRKWGGLTKRLSIRLSINSLPIHNHRLTIATWNVIKDSALKMFHIQVVY